MLLITNSSRERPETCHWWMQLVLKSNVSFTQVTCHRIKPPQWGAKGGQKKTKSAAGMIFWFRLTPQWACFLVLVGLRRVVMLTNCLRCMKLKPEAAMCPSRTCCRTDNTSGLVKGCNCFSSCLLALIWGVAKEVPSNYSVCDTQLGCTNTNSRS